MGAPILHNFASFASPHMPDDRPEGNTMAVGQSGR